jgi:hypothetical protein
MGNRTGEGQEPGGILIRVARIADLAAERQRLLDLARQAGLSNLIELSNADEQPLRFRLRPEAQQQYAPAFGTLHLCERFALQPDSNAADLEKEILLAMLLGPVTFEYPSVAELAASIRIRRNIVTAARRTALAFDTDKIERPVDYWTYSEETGFILKPGKPLIDALRMATQPDTSGQQYAFSCYRATEYVILLGLAEELADCNPALLQQLQQRWQARSIMSGLYHEVFLREYGSMEAPLPPLYYVPGDRLWFRNPDERSSDVTGYEGSWVLYLGGGLFTNFWKCDKPYSMTDKCIEIYHWRDGLYLDANGEPQMDESIVEERVRATMHKPGEVARILERMMRLRDPKGVYAEGGCIDTSREYLRWVCPGTSDIVLPD